MTLSDLFADLIEAAKGRRSPVGALAKPVTMSPGVGTRFHELGSTGYAKSNTVDFDTVIRSIRFDAAGDVKIRDVYGNAHTMTVVAGEIFNQGAVAGIYATGTTIANTDILLVE